MLILKTQIEHLEIKNIIEAKNLMDRLNNCNTAEKRFNKLENRPEKS